VKEAAWKVVAIALLLALVCTAAVMGYYWSVAAHDRDENAAELKIEQGVSEQLREGIGKQNAAAKAANKAKLQAEERGAQAKALAAANGRHYQDALSRAEGAKASTCAEAMGVVNQILESVR
jgi:hypothetical protein